jgi:hypothetical protein
MSKLSKLQDERLKKLKEASAASRDQRDAALETPEAATATVPEPAPAAKPKMGRPPKPEPMYQRTVSFTKDQLSKLEKLSSQSGRKGFRSPTFNETVRVAMRMWASHEWTQEEIRAAFDVELGPREKDT